MQQNLARSRGSFSFSGSLSTGTGRNHIPFHFRNCLEGIFKTDTSVNQLCCSSIPGHTKAWPHNNCGICRLKRTSPNRLTAKRSGGRINCIARSSVHAHAGRTSEIVVAPLHTLLLPSCSSHVGGFSFHFQLHTHNVQGQRINPAHTIKAWMSTQNDKKKPRNNKETGA